MCAGVHGAGCKVRRRGDAKGVATGKWARGGARGGVRGLKHEDMAGLHGAG